MRISIASIIVSAGILLAGCAGAAPPAQSQRVALPSAGPSGTYGGFAWPEGMPAADRYIHIALGPDALDECTAVRPHFAFDSHQLRGQDVSVLKALANCLNAPAFAQRTVALVGRADRRGELGYNEVLGRFRAERVKTFLVEQGVDEQRIQVLTRGERDAQADGLYGHGWDRRVDVIVLGGAHQPFGATASTPR